MIIQSLVLKAIPYTFVSENLFINVVPEAFHT